MIVEAARKHLMLGHMQPAQPAQVKPAPSIDAQPDGLTTLVKHLQEELDPGLSREYRESHG